MDEVANPGAVRIGGDPDGSGPCPGTREGGFANLGACYAGLGRLANVRYWGNSGRCVGSPESISSIDVGRMLGYSARYATPQELVAAYRRNHGLG